MVYLHEEEKVSPRKIPPKVVVKKIEEKLGAQDEKSESSSEFDDAFDMDYTASPIWGRKKADRHSGSQLLGINVVFTSILQKIKCPFDKN